MTLVDLAASVGEDEAMVAKALRGFALELPSDLDIDDWVALFKSQDSEGLDIRIGADPEFSVVDNTGRTVSAARWIHDDNHTAQLGLDGTVTGELRPPPGTPEQVTASIRGLMTQLRAVIPPRYTVVCGEGQDNSLGGHIHISGRDITPALLYGLERWVTNPLKMLAPNNDNVRGDYASSINHRRNSHGLEFRSPPSWIGHPILTYGVLATAWTLAYSDDKAIMAVETPDALYDLAGARAQAIERFQHITSTGRAMTKHNVWQAWGIDEPGIPEYSEPAFSTSDAYLGSILARLVIPKVEETVRLHVTHGANASAAVVPMHLFPHGFEGRYSWAAHATRTIGIGQDLLISNLRQQGIHRNTGNDNLSPVFADLVRIAEVLGDR